MSGPTPRNLIWDRTVDRTYAAISATGDARARDECWLKTSWAVDATGAGGALVICLHELTEELWHPR